MNITELKAQLEQRKQEKQIELANLKETITLQHELNKLDSPIYNKRELVKQDSLTLDIILGQIEEAYRTNKRKVSQVYGYGIIPNKLLTILKAIQFSKSADKEELLLITNLDEQIVEDTLDSFGSTAYFSKVAVEIIPEIAMQKEKVKELLTTVAIDMKLVSELDLSKFNTANIDYQYKRAQLNAEELLTNTQEYATPTTSYEE